MVTTIVRASCSCIISRRIHDTSQPFRDLLAPITNLDNMNTVTKSISSHLLCQFCFARSVWDTNSSIHAWYTRVVYDIESGHGKFNQVFLFKILSMNRNWLLLKSRKPQVPYSQKGFGLQPSKSRSYAACFSDNQQETAVLTIHEIQRSHILRRSIWIRFFKVFKIAS